MPDYSRYLAQPEKHYASVRMQQGRVMLDSDWNESEHIDDEEARRILVDVIGPKGTNNEGFLVDQNSIDTNVSISLPDSPPSEIQTYDFKFANGSFYIGGLRFDADLDPGPESFLKQTDWLQIDSAAENLPMRPDDLEPGQTRFDLIYLLGWEQPVSAVEDRELRERALGGPDTSVRMRRMRRIIVKIGVPSSCEEAFAALQDELTGGVHRFNDESCELESSARLTVLPADDGEIEDLCRPSVTSGFLGAENQTIRIELIAPNQFVWGFDNASPLYRVRVADAARTRIEFLTLPADQAAQPLAGQVVEILQWSALLPNGEIISERQGFFSKVATSFDPGADSAPFITLLEPVPEEWLNWQNNFVATEGLGREPYFYMRVWQRGFDLESPAVANFTPLADPADTDDPNFVILGNTGLKTGFSQTGIPGDHWIVAARPNTPDIVVPWELMKQAKPHGTRLFYAPLALITWTRNASGLQSAVQDCRKTFRSLCETGGCCTITVGDGKQSQGNVTSIQQAVNLLPASGGEICVLPGQYLESVVIDGRRNVLIHGCGNRTVLQAPDGKTGPVLHIRNCENITVHSMALHSPVSVGVLMEKGMLSRVQTRRLTLAGITLENLEILCRDNMAIVCTGGNRISIRNNRIVHALLETSLADNKTIGRLPAVFVAGDDLLIEGNRIEQADVQTRDSLHTAFGGLQIGGDSNRVEVRGNRIHGGNGNGITLGSIDFAPPVVIRSAAQLIDFFRADRVRSVRPFPVRVLDIGCIQIDPLPRPPVDDVGDPLVPFSEGPLTDVTIADNKISGMGRSGISVAQFFDLSMNPAVIITVDRLTIEGNYIVDCMRLELGDLPQPLHEAAGFGGIALADGDKTLIRRNIIENNGTDRFDSICGIFMLRGGGLSIDNNRILNNGRRLFAGQTPPPGQRGGIIIALAEPALAAPSFPEAPVNSRLDPSFQLRDGAPSARIHGNTVASPSGRALQLQAKGTVSVLGNQLTTALPRLGIIIDPVPAGETPVLATTTVARVAAVPLSGILVSRSALTAFLNTLGGTVVFINNLGSPLDPANLTGGGNFGRFNPVSGLALAAVIFQPVFFGGNILFNDNQVLLDGFGPGATSVFSSVFLNSRDDISMIGNQCDCDLIVDSVQTNVLVMGRSIRVANNRFREVRNTALLSAFTTAQMNSTVNNQSTHCIFATAPSSGARVFSGNQSVVELENSSACKGIV